MTTRKEMNYARSNGNICSNCGSKLIFENNTIKCSMDQYDFWREQIKYFNTMSESEQNLYLDSIQDKHRSTFTDLVKNIDTYDCGFSLNIISVSSNSLRVPDPFQVRKAERLLKRELTESEREEGYIFKIKDEVFTLDFMNYLDQ